MNQRLWEAHLVAEVERLKTELAQLRRDLSTQRKRAELWRTRALNNKR